MAARGSGPPDGGCTEADARQSWLSASEKEREEAINSVIALYRKQMAEEGVPNASLAGMLTDAHGRLPEGWALAKEEEDHTGKGSGKGNPPSKGSAPKPEGQQPKAVGQEQK